MEFMRTVTLDQQLDKQKVKDIISKFLRQEWPSVRPEELLITKVDPLVRGFSNQVYIVDRNAGDKEPSKVVVKFYTDQGKNPIRMTWAEQDLFHLVSGSTGLGPKLIGTFPGGRVDEFIPSHSSQPKEHEDPLMTAEIARAYARFHSLDLPLDKTRQQVIDGNMVKFFEETRLDPDRKWINIITGAGIDAVPHLTYGYDQEIRWLYQELTRVGSKKVWCHVDAHHFNILIREDCNSERVALIDYQYASYQYRAFDLGCICVAMMVQDNNAVDRRYPGGKLLSPESTRRLCSTYLSEIRKLNSISITDDKDTEDQLVQEACLGSMLNLIWLTYICDANADKLIQHDRSFSLMSVWMHQVFLDIKQQYFSRYKVPKYEYSLNSVC